MPGAAKRIVHVVAANSGWDTVDELVPALENGGALVNVHRLPPPRDAPEDQPERRRAELALALAAVRASEADGGRLLLADERGAMAVPLRMRILLDEQGLGWDEAWARTRALTVSRFGCPGGEPSRPYWHVAALEAEEPRLLELVFEINRRHLDAVEARWPGDGARRRRLSLVREGDLRRLRLGMLAVLGSEHASIAAPWQGPASEILADFSALCGMALVARATPTSRGASSPTTIRRSPSCSRARSARASRTTPRPSRSSNRSPSRPRSARPSARLAAETASGWPRSCARRRASTRTPRRSWT